MAYAIFLRAANVGGHQVFSPKTFSQEHPELRLTSIGAAGTFASQADGGASDVEAAMRAALPVDADMAVVPADDVTDLVAAKPFSDAPAGAKAEVTVVLGGRSAGDLEWPEGEDAIRVHRDEGWCILTCRDRGARGRSPYQVVEKALGAPATTRSWGVMGKLASALEP